MFSEEVPLEQAKRIPGLRTVDEVYPDPVRVVSVGVPVVDLLSLQDGEQTSVELCCGTHLLRTGEIQDLVVISERQLVKGVSRIVAVTGQDAKEAREAGETLTQEVESLLERARLAASATMSLSAAQRLAKEVGLLTDSVDSTPIPQWQRRELQSHLKTLQRSSNTIIRKLETAEAAVKAQCLLKKNGNRSLVVDTLDTDSISMVMKTVNQYCSRSPGSHVMLLSHHQGSKKVLCACQVPKGSGGLSACEWALAVCVRLKGNAGGSATVAQGTGSASDITEALQWATEYARSKTELG